MVAASLFPAVAALHAIVLAAVHVDGGSSSCLQLTAAHSYVGAVDMDVFGAFQFCSIGILAAPVTVRSFQTYFNHPGRNTIFLWTALLLAGNCPWHGSLGYAKVIKAC